MYECLVNDCVLQNQARAVELLVRAKMQHREFIILCLEDCSDWSNATTRRIVMQVCSYFLSFPEIKIDAQISLLLLLGSSCESL